MSYKQIEIMQVKNQEIPQFDGFKNIEIVSTYETLREAIQASERQSYGLTHYAPDFVYKKLARIINVQDKDFPVMVDKYGRILFLMTTPKGLKVLREFSWIGSLTNAPYRTVILSPVGEFLAISEKAYERSENNAEIFTSRGMIVTHEL